MGRPACLHPDTFLSVEHLLLAAHPAFFLFVKMSNVIILFLLKKDELRNKTVACIFCAPSHIFWSLLSVWSTLQVVNSLWGYNNMYTAMQFLCTFIPQSSAEHNSSWCHDYSCQMSHGGVQAFVPLSWWLWGAVLGKSCRRSTIVRKRNENQLEFFFCQWVKSAVQDIWSYCNNKSSSVSFNFHLLGLGSFSQLFHTYIPYELIVS